jgi:hypothetical protein
VCFVQGRVAREVGPPFDLCFITFVQGRGGEKGRTPSDLRLSLSCKGGVARKVRALRPVCHAGEGEAGEVGPLPFCVSYKGGVARPVVTCRGVIRRVW